MNKQFLITILFLTGFTVFSQTKGITETGDEVILYKNGTWEYENDSLNISSITENNKQFAKSKKSTFLVKSEIKNIGIWVNPKNWSFSKGEPNGAAEFSFEVKGKDIRGMLITEKIEVPIENLIELAISNAKDAASNIKVIKKEYRKINGLKVIMMQLTGTLSGIKFIYYGYYYSNSNGSIQLVTYTSQGLFEKSKEDMEELLNGFVEY